MERRRTLQRLIAPTQCQRKQAKATETQFDLWRVSWRSKRISDIDVLLSLRNRNTTSTCRECIFIFLSQIFLLKGEEHASEECASLEQEARNLLEDLLKPVRREDILARQLESDETRMEEIVLFDYLVPWGYRIMVPQDDSHSGDAVDAS